MPVERAPKRTQVGTPGNHRQIALRFDALLRRLGLLDANLRKAYTAHAMGVAIGWKKQNCWWYNAWAVKRGKGTVTDYWVGDWYVMGTVEEVQGKDVQVPTAQWRAFDNWTQALKDTQERIGPNSWNEHYKKAYEAALKGDCRGYWAELGLGGYYTETHWMQPDNFISVCNRVERELREATDAEKADAERWVDEQQALGLLGPAEVGGTTSGTTPEDEKKAGYGIAVILGMFAFLAAGIVALWKKK